MWEIDFKFALNSTPEWMRAGGLGDRTKPFKGLPKVNFDGLGKNTGISGQIVAKTTEWE